MFAAWERGDTAAAREINAAMGPSFDYETGPAAPNPIPTKALLRLLGRPSGRCRPPMDAEPAGLADDAKAVLATTRLGRELGFG